MKLNSPSIYGLAVVLSTAALAMTACKPNSEAEAMAGASAVETGRDGTVASNDAGQAGSPSPAQPQPEASSPADIIRDAPTGAGVPLGPVNAADRQFLVKAAEGGLYELQAAELAAQRAVDPSVKAFAETLVKDHRAANEKLRDVAAGLNVPIPSSLPDDKQKEIDELQRTSAQDFDKRFVQTVGIDDHKDDIDLFEKASRQSNDPALRGFALSALPTLRAHLDAARRLPVKGVKGGGDT